MNPKTLAALEDSIKKWEDIAVGADVDLGVLNCPLCDIFYKPGNVNICDGCPVREHTGLSGCRGTPYDEAAELVDLDGRAETAPAISASWKEVAFLRTLLPIDHSKHLTTLDYINKYVNKPEA